jgi:hypothetical protein
MNSIQHPREGGRTFVSRIPLAIVCLALALQIQGRLIPALDLLPNSKVHDRQLVQQRRVSLLRVERPLCKTQLHHRPYPVPIPPLTIMLLDNLQKARVIDIAELLQLLNLVGDIIEFRLQLLQSAGRDIALFLRRRVGIRRCQLLKLIEGSVNAVLQRIELLLLELRDLLELHVEDLLTEAVLVLLGPFSAVVLGLVFAEEALKFGVVDVLVLPRRVDGRAQGLAETHLASGREQQFVGCRTSSV